MKAFAAPVEDMLFTLEHVAGAPRIDGWDSALAREIAGYFADFAAGVIAPLNGPGDRQGCRLEKGRVSMPDGFREAYHDYTRQGWPALSISADHGGQGLPCPVSGLVTEIFAGACHAMQMVVGLVPGAFRTLQTFGTPEQLGRHVQGLVSGDVLPTMCLTEPQAGSDLSAIRTRAVERDGKWWLTGEKIFISGGDQNLTDRILHFVLARTGAADSSALTLFLCPSHDTEGARNGITVIRIEEKMGLHASPTCQLAFDDAFGEMLGEVGGGLKAMFTMMNHARADVALQGVAHAGRAYDIASSYAAERIQGRDVVTRKKISIDRHAPVAWMLDRQAALSLGARAMCYEALVALEMQGDSPLVDFLTPVCKAFATDIGSECADIAIQVLGGYGFMQEYEVEQTLRDARVCRIYEGTNEIHALTLAGRLLSNRGGVAANAFDEFVANAIKEAGLPEQAFFAEECLASWRQARQRIAGAPDFPADAHAFMKLTAFTIFAVSWLKMEAQAHHAPDPDRIRRLGAFVRGHMAPEARYWAELCSPR